MDTLIFIDNLIREVRGWPCRSALLVIDMQNDFLDSQGSMGLRGTDLSMAQACIQPILQLCQAARERHVLIIWALAGYSGERLPPVPFPGADGSNIPVKEKLFGTHVGKTAICVPGTWGARLHPSFEARAEDMVVEKHYFSAFSDTSLDELLQARRISHLVVCGVTTANCVRATVTDAWLRGYRVTVPQDTTASWTMSQYIAAWECLKLFVSAPARYNNVFSLSSLSSSTSDRRSASSSYSVENVSTSHISSSASFLFSSSPTDIVACEKLDVAIIGAGIGGLALALYLHRHDAGLRVAVFERDASFDVRAQGYSLTIQGGLKALEKLGVAEDVCKQAVKGGSGQVVMHSSGKCLVALGGGSNSSSRNVFIPRQRLRALMFEQLQTSCVRWGKALVRLHEDTKGVVLHFSNNTQARAQLVVGADGVHSVVRRLKLGDELHYLGVLALNGIASFRHPLCPHGNLQIVRKTFLKWKDDVAAHSSVRPCEGRSILS